MARGEGGREGEQKGCELVGLTGGANRIKYVENEHRSSTLDFIVYSGRIFRVSLAERRTCLGLIFFHIAIGRREGKGDIVKKRP